MKEIKALALTQNEANGLHDIIDSLKNFCMPYVECTLCPFKQIENSNTCALEHFREEIDILFEIYEVTDDGEN